MIDLKEDGQTVLLGASVQQLLQVDDIDAQTLLAVRPLQATQNIAVSCIFHIR